jgi:hypothetical protein
MSDDALTIAILAARQALEAANRSDDTAKAVVNALNTISEALTVLTRVIHDAVYDDEDDEDDEDDGDTAKSPKQGGTPGLVVDEPTFSAMPELSGVVYPEYTREMDAMLAAGDPDPLVPLMHIAPISDTYPHETSKLVCWCHPTVETQGGLHVVVHNAADGRDQPETHKHELH